MTYRRWVATAGLTLAVFSAGTGAAVASAAQPAGNPIVQEFTGTGTSSIGGDIGKYLALVNAGDDAYKKANADGYKTDRCVPTKEFTTHDDEGWHGTVKISCTKLF
ncbi:hypothetical protein [Amycolatopsis sp. NPDC004378]